MHEIGKQVFWEQPLVLYFFFFFDSEIFTDKDMFVNCTFLGREAGVIAIQIENLSLKQTQSLKRADEFTAL